MTREPTEMETRVANVLWNRMNGSEVMDKYDRMEFVWHARAAIRAMRDPAPGMPHMNNAACVHLWYDMIDAASPQEE